MISTKQEGQVRMLMLSDGLMLTCPSCFVEIKFFKNDSTFNYNMSYLKKGLGCSKKIMFTTGRFSYVNNNKGWVEVILLQAFFSAQNCSLT